MGTARHSRARAWPHDDVNISAPIAAIDIDGERDVLADVDFRRNSCPREPRGMMSAPAAPDEWRLCAHQGSGTTITIRSKVTVSTFDASQPLTLPQSRRLSRAYDKTFVCMPLYRPMPTGQQMMAARAREPPHD